MQRRPEDILAKIDELLKSCKVSGYDKDFNDPEYINHQEQYHKVTWPLLISLQLITVLNCRLQLNSILM